MMATYQSGESPVRLGRPESKRKTKRRRPSSKERSASRLIKLVLPWYIFLLRYRVFQKEVLNEFQGSSFILSSSQEIYLCSQKFEACPVILHMITFHNSNYCLRYIKSLFKIDHKKVDIYSNLWLFFC